MEVAAIWRHPIKGVGREPLDRVDLTPGATVPQDRIWAVAHEAARLDGRAWVSCRNFNRGAAAPGLMAVELSREGDRLRLRHPDLEDLVTDPDAEPEAVAAWIAPLVPANRSAPVRVIRAAGQGFTDSAFPSISVGNLSSLRALSDKVGRPLAPERFRMNLWVEGMAPWEEWDWLDREIRFGGATLRVEARVDRCRATMADPATGRIDADTLAALEDGWGHRDFGVYAVCTAGGAVARGDAVAPA